MTRAPRRADRVRAGRTAGASAVVALPVMELAFPAHMPALLILAGSPLVALMAAIERPYIDAPTVAQVSTG